MHVTTPSHYALCHTAACIPLGTTASSGCLPEGSSSHGHRLSRSTIGAPGGALLLLGQSGLSTSCEGLQGGQHSPALLSHPMCPHKQPALLGCK